MDQDLHVAILMNGIVVKSTFGLDFLAHVVTDYCISRAFVTAAVEGVLEVTHVVLRRRDRRDLSSLLALLCVSFWVSSRN